MELYKDIKIFSKDNKFTVGTKNNFNFNDCTLENFECGDEHDNVLWNMMHNNEVVFEDIRGSKGIVSYEDYTNHLEKYNTEDTYDFLNDEFIVPMVRFSTIEKAKEFIDAHYVD